MISLICSVKETYSGSGQLRAILRKDKCAQAESHEEPQQFIEVAGSLWGVVKSHDLLLIQVWDGEGLVKCICVGDLKKTHGKIHEDGKKRR